MQRKTFLYTNFLISENKWPLLISVLESMTYRILDRQSLLSESRS
jgi:hypothetical protein